MNAARRELNNLKRRLQAAQSPGLTASEQLLIGLGLFGLGVLAGVALKHFDAPGAVRKLYWSATESNGRYPSDDENDLDQNLGIGA